MQAESASLKRGSHSNPLVAFQKCVIQNAEGKVMFEESSLFVCFFTHRSCSLILGQQSSKYKRSMLAMRPQTFRPPYLIWC